MGSFYILGTSVLHGRAIMKAGDMVKMKDPKTRYSWRLGAGEGIGVIITAAHRTARTMRGCTVFWSAEQEIKDVPEAWLDVINESG